MRYSGLVVVVGDDVKSWNQTLALFKQSVTNYPSCSVKEHKKMCMLCHVNGSSKQESDWCFVGYL